MGAHLVARVYTTWSHLPDRPFRLLTHMALIIKDATPKPTYWGGREAMCQALGLPVESQSSHQAVKRAVRRLVDEGALERVRNGHAGSRSEYELRFERGSSAAPLRGSLTAPHRGSVNDPHRGSLVYPAGGTPVTPQGTTRGETEDNGEEDGLLTNATVVSGRLRSRKASSSRLQVLREQLDDEAAS